MILAIVLIAAIVLFFGFFIVTYDRNDSADTKLAEMAARAPIAPTFVSRDYSF